VQQYSIDQLEGWWRWRRLVGDHSDWYRHLRVDRVVPVPVVEGASESATAVIGGFLASDRDKEVAILFLCNA